MKSRLGCPDLGVGVGLRVPHYRTILSEKPPVECFEIISENFMVGGGKPLFHLERIGEVYPLIQHGVSLGIGGPREPDAAYVTALRALVDRVKPPWVSDHFCWCGVPGANLHDLLPLPYTAEAVSRVVERAKAVQDRLGVRFALENTSTYLAYTSSTMPEWEFVSQIVERADIGLMFDVNNVYVSAYNHGFDPFEFVRSIPHDRIVQVHLAGHTNLGTHIIDTHSGGVIDPVMDLYRETIALTGSVTTIVEWDDAIPPLPELLAEAARAKSVRDEGLRLRDARARGEAAPTPNRDWARALVERGSAATPLQPEAHREWMQGGPRERAAWE